MHISYVNTIIIMFCKNFLDIQISVTPSKLLCMLTKCYVNGYLDNDNILIIYIKYFQTKHK